VPSYQAVWCRTKPTQAMTNQAEQAIPHTRADNSGPATPPSEKPHTSVTPPSLPRPRLPVRKPDLEPASAKTAPCRATLAPLQHCIARSDTLQGLAVRYGVTPNAILAHNKLPNAQALFARHAIAIPSPPASRRGGSGEPSSPAVPGVRGWVTFDDSGRGTDRGAADQPDRRRSARARVPAARGPAPLALGQPLTTHAGFGWGEDWDQPWLCISDRRGGKRGPQPSACQQGPAMVPFDEDEML
jgi:LysM repeat protein